MSERKLEIRTAVESDVARIVELSGDLFQEDAGKRDPYINLDWPWEAGAEHYSNLVSGENSLCLLAELDGEVVGYLAGYVRQRSSLRNVNMAELESMFVEQEFRRYGVGHRLCQQFVVWCKNKGVERVSVTAYTDNERAIAFYEMLGFRPKELTLEWGIE